MKAIRFLFVVQFVLFGSQVTEQSSNNVDQRDYHSINNQQHNSQSGKGINDGHRLITRALWRIFDALMEKKNHEELYGRVKFVEGTITDMISSDSKLDTQLDSMTATLNGYKDEMSHMKKEVEKIKGLETRIREIEEWQLRLERQRDDGAADSSVGAYAQPGFSACPPPFEAVGGECMYVCMEQKRGWRDARRECARIGGDLASPRDLAALRSYLRSLPNERRPEYTWVGGSRTDDNVWIWSTGSQAGKAMDMSQSTWNEELPEGIGNCLGLYERAGYRAYDYTCEEEDYYICQYFF